MTIFLLVFMLSGDVYVDEGPFVVPGDCYAAAEVYQEVGASAWCVIKPTELY
jgi:hypothetical protein